MALRAIRQRSKYVSVDESLERKRDAFLTEKKSPSVDESEASIAKKWASSSTNGRRDIGPCGDQLCSRCSTIDLDAIFSLEISSVHGRWIVALEELTGDLEGSSCPLCRLFAAVAVPMQSKARYENRGYHLRAFKISLLQLTAREEETGLKNSKVVLGVMRGSSKTITRPEERDECLAHGIIAAVTTTEEPTQEMAEHEAHVVQTTKPNYGQLRRWIANCNNDHSGSCKMRASHSLTHLTCIDCFTHSLVRINICEEYCTLSYVWGLSARNDISSQPQLTCGSSIPSKVPQVIEDAMEVVKSLGRRYLWVDKYCIDQGNAQEKHIQIQHMGQVYEGALVTIVAADGESDQAGLPGVGDLMRKPQASATIGRWHLVSTLKDISFLLRLSVWATRGWTYQEAVLSRRCLFFTKQQVYFVCRAMTCCEALDKLTSTHESLECGKSLLDTQIFGRDEIWREKKGGLQISRIGLWSFFEHLSRYKRKVLTFSSDALNAFRGIMSTFPFQTIWGIPIACEPNQEGVRNSTYYDIGFARGLWWERDFLGPCWLNRSPGFPSWSWAGWEGPVGSFYAADTAHHQVDSRCHAVSRDDFDARFLITYKDGRRQSLQELCTSKIDQDLESNLSHELICEATVVKVRIQPPTTVRPTIQLRREPIGHVCDCHPNGLHEGGKILDHSAAELELFEDPAANKTFSDRLYNQLWDCIVLFYNNEYFNLIVIDWHGDTAHRIGNVSLSKHVYDKLPKTRRVIRLA